MRTLLMAASILAALGAAAPASAETICGSGDCLQLAQDRSLREKWYDWDTRPRPQVQPEWYGAGPSARRDLGYYCGLGRKTPRHLRDDCRRYGYW